MPDKPLSELSPAERRALLKELLRKKTAEAPPAPTLSPDPQARFDPFPPTPIQEAYLLGRRPGFAVSGVGCHAYSECDARDVDPDRLEAAWNALIARHDMLRAVVGPDGVRVLPDVPAYRFARLDLRGLPIEATDAALAELRRDMSTALRDPAAWPPFELRLTRLADDRWRVHIDLELMTIDASATLRLVHEWGRLYAGETLPELPALRFRDYRLALRALEDGPAARQARAYWEPRLQTLPGPPDLQLVADPGAASTVPSRRTLQLSPARWTAFKTAAQARGLTPNAALAAAFSAALATYATGDAHTLTVTLFDRRPLHPDVAELLGEFTNTLLLEVRGRTGSFTARAQALQDQLARDLEHTAWPGVHVVRELNRRRGGITGFPVVFTSTLAARTGATPGAWLGEWTAGASQTPQVFLDHQIFEEDGGLRINWDTVDAVFAPGLVDALFASWRALVDGLADDPTTWDAPVGDLLLPTQRATRAATQTWPGEPPVDTLHDPFLRQAARTPDATAVTGPDLSFTYAQLAAHSADLAHRLAQLGATGLVAVCLPRSPLQAVATLGVLRAGAAYLPIDPDLPPARIRTLLTDGQATLVVTDPSTADRLREHVPDGTTFVPVLADIAQQPPSLPNVPPEALAYVIYTSGSTGQPKGVAMQHRAAWNTIAAISDRFHVTATDRVLALSALSFDLSVYDLFGVLAAGGTVVFPPPDAIRDPSTWPLEGITLWNTVPQLMEMLLESGRPLPPTLRLVLWSGDWIPLTLPPRVRQQLPTATLVSLGGATEAAIWSIAHVIKDIDPTWTSIPYGTPLPHQTFHILDDSLQPRPDGVQGDLYIGGAGLAQGYWNDPEKTAERFITHPTTGERLYRTGDLGRYFSNGSIEFLGRADSQVKIRGHRIELGEIETTLLQHPGIAAAVAGTPDRRRLVAWYVPRPLPAPDATIAPRWDSALTAARAAVLPTPSSDVPAVMASLGERAILWIVSGLARLGFFRAADESHATSDLLAAVAPERHPWLHRALHALVDAGWLARQEDRHTALRPFPELPPPLPDTGPGALLEPYGEALPDLLTGRKSSLELFFAGGDLDAASALYALGFDEASALVADLVAALAPRAVLEVGAGVGATTGHVLKRLPEETDYCFTDVSHAFLDRARRLFARPGLRTALLDIDRDLEDQSIALARHDLVLASGVLHVARRVDASLARLALLLRPGGALVLVEHTRFLPMMHLLPGLQPGFDAFEDRDLRPDHCLLSAEQWRERLHLAGFDRVELLDGPTSAATGLRVLVARRDPSAPAAVTPTHDELAAHLAARLPAIMVPGLWVPLAALPLSANGKLDRKALPTPAEVVAAEHADATPQQAAIARVWAEVLGLPAVGLHDDYFALGGDSLIAVRLLARLREALDVDVPLRVLFAHPTVAALGDQLAALSPATDTALQPDPAHRFDPFPLTDLQQAYWLGRTEGLAGGDVASWVYVEIDTHLTDPTRWESAWRALIDAHDALRIVLRPDGTQQALETAPPWHLPLVDLRDVPDPDARLAARFAELSQQVLPLDRWPLFDIQATRFATPAGERLRLHVGVDVLLVDGRSFSRLIGQWTALAAGERLSITPPPISFRDVVLALARAESGPTFAADRAWWLARLDTLPPAPQLPIRRESGASGRFVRRVHQLDDATWQRLQAAAKRHGLTPATALLTAYAATLAAWSVRPRFSLNLTLFHRPPLHPAIDEVIGELTLTTLLAVAVDPARPFAAFAAAIQARMAEDLDHRAFSGVRVLRELAQREGGPVAMPVIFTGALGLDEAALGDRGTYGAGLSQTPQVWLDHQAVGGLGDGGVRLIWDAAEDRFHPGTLDAMFAAYLGLLNHLSSETAVWTRPLPPLLPSEQHAARVATQTWPGEPAVDTLHDPFLRQAARTPDATAVTGPDLSFTYAQLAARSADLAHRLAQLGATGLVAVCLPKSPLQAVATLGVLRAGAAYLPIDPDLPPARIRTLLTDGQATLVVTDPATADRLREHVPDGTTFVPVLSDIAQQPPSLPTVPPEALAYVIYTSGSTGQPKGVAMQHRAAWNTIAAISDRFHVTDTDRVLALSALSFDLSVYDLFGVLAAGGTVVFPPPDAIRDPSTWPLEHITLWNTVPQLMEMLLESGRPLPPSLRLVLWSGDWIPLTLPPRVRQQLPHATLVSLGGATEAAIWSIGHVIDAIDPTWTSIPYGTPLPHQTFHVLDDALQPRPDGVQGDLYIGGAGLAQGYWNDPEKTAERFITHPTTGERLYRTGDLGRYFSNGSIEFLGRADSQVKIRGHRIELGEIESTLLRHPGVAAAVAGTPDRRRLVAWYVPRPGVPTDDLLQFLTARLPEPLVPGALVALLALPLSRNGKLDRAALPLPGARDDGTPDNDTLDNPLQASVARIWADALGLASVGLHDDFFRLGGDSLVAVRLSARLRELLGLDVRVRDIFARPTVAELTRQLGPAAPAPLPVLVHDPAHRFDPFPLTDLQHAYWLGRTHGVALGGVGAYLYLELEPAQRDPARWERAWRALVAAHDALRTIVLPDGTQRVLRDTPAWSLPVLDLRGRPDPDPDLDALRRRMSQQVLAPDRWPLFDLRASLRDTDDHDTTLRLHIGIDLLIADGWSILQLLRQWAALAEQDDPRADAPAIGFRDVVLAQAAEVGTPGWDADRRWWLDRLDDLPPAPELPLRSDDAPLQYVRRELRLPRDRWARFQAAATRRGLTPTSALLACYAAVLAAWSAQPRFTLNLSLFHRPSLHPQIDAVLGDFTRTALLALDVAASEPFAAAARRAQTRLVDDLEHAGFSGVRVLRELAQRRGGPVLMPVVFTGAVGLGRGEDTTALGDHFRGLTQTPQVLLDNQVLGGPELLAVWDAAEDRFPPGVLDAMFAAYVALLHHLSAETDAWDAPLPPLLPPEQRAARAATQTWPDHPATDTLHAPFLRQAAREPDATALVGPDLSFTYGQLAAASADLARRLVQLGAAGLVAVCLPKSPLHAVATLGILRAGAAYLPLDPDLPPARIHTLLTDGQARLVVTDPATADRLREHVPDGTTLIHVLSDIPEQPAAPLPDISPDALAYVIYTSGSTGRPKGVAVQHRAAWNTIAAINLSFAVNPADRVLALSALSFDLSVYDLFGVLAAGGTVVFPPPDAIRDPSTWPLEHITLWNTVPQLMEMLLESGRPLPPTLRLVLWSGDWIPLTLPPRVRQQLPHTTLVSLGGATEAAIWSIAHVIEAIDPTWTSIPYGTPLPHQIFHILDDSLQPRPDGVQGDLYIGGAGLAQGYWNDPEKTAERFITHPTTGERLYRTGDLGRYFSNGSIEFLGRADSQVKIRGHRIELGEIESTLAQHPGIAAAVAGTPDRRRLVAWYVPRPGVPTDDLLQFLAARLPAALVPGTLVPLEALPLSRNGKLDRAALPLPQEPGDHRPPTTPLERAVAGAWIDLLDVPDVGVDQPFFQLGGDSLSAVRVAARLTAALGRDVPVRLLLGNPTIAGLARAIAALPAAAPLPAILPDPAHRFDPFPLTEVQRAYWLGRAEGFALGGLAAWISLEFEPTIADPARWEAAWRALLHAHDALRTIVRPDGTQQALPDAPDWSLPVDDLRGRPDALARLDLLRREMSGQHRPADRWPLFDLRAALLDGPDGAILRLFFGLDVLIADGFSVVLLLQQWARLARDDAPSLAPPALSFRDVVTAQLADDDTPEWHADRRWWQARLEQLPPAPELPVVRDATARAPRFGRRVARLDPARLRRLQQRAAARGVTPANALLAAYAATLAAWSARTAFTLNLTLFHRPPLHPAIEQVVGDFTRTSLLALDVARRDGFTALVRRVHARLADDLEHNRFSGIRVLRELSARRGAPVLMPVVFTSGLSMGMASALRELGRPIWGVTQTPQVWLDHQLAEDDDGLLVMWDAAEERFLPGVLDAMFAAHVDLLHHLSAETDTWDAPLPTTLPPGQLATRAATQTWPGEPAVDTLHDPFLRQAARTPDATAVTGPDLSFTYAQLAARSADLAHRLAQLGATGLVAVCLPKSPLQAVATLGVLRSGAAYLPIDPDLPPARIRTLLTDGQAHLVVADLATADRLREHVPDGTTFVPVLSDIAQQPPSLPNVPPEALAYVIYTSGSTGQPKGVAMQHRAAWNTIAAISDRFHVTATDRVLALSALSFDLSVYDLFGVLAVGGTVVFLPPDAIRDPSTWPLEHITLWNTVPQLMEMLLESGRPLPPTLRLVLWSGDWIPLTLPPRVRQQLPHATLVSLGGATEAAIWSIGHVIDDIDPTWTSIPYGTPLPHQTFHVLDDALQPRPDGVQGDLYIGGAGLAQGYWNDPEKTAERFITHPTTGERLYRTGDLGRYFSNGSIEFLGRADSQVKIRGHRIELGEIETTLAQHPGVAAAVAGTPDRRRLVAWYVPRPLPVDLSPAAASWPAALDAARACHDSQPDAPAEFDGFLARSTAWTADQIAAALADLGFFRAAGERWTAAAVTSAVVPPFHRWVRRILKFLHDTGRLQRDGDTYVSTAPAPTREALLPDARDLEPGELALLRLLQRYGAALPQILTGRQSPLEILFEGGQAGEALAFYAGGFAEANAVVGALLDALQAGEPRRILEFGAGVGGTTRSLLPRLVPGTTYTFTDVSRYFLEVATRELHVDGLRTALLDIDRDPRAQGFPAAGHDIVVGASVLHVARRLAVSIGHLARLVAPGGALVLIEATRLLPLLHLVMALQPGFDNFEDTDLRPEHCLLDADRWTSLLRAGGFDDVRVFARRGSMAERTGVQVIVARRAADARVLADLPPDALRSFAAARLPEPLVPAAFIALDALPLSANGKLDRAALPVPRELAAGEQVAPRTPLERAVTSVWADVLGLDAVGTRDPFFAVGGDSLSAVRVAARLGEALGRDVPVRLLFANPDAATLAAQLDALAPAPARPALAPDAAHRHDPFPLTDVQRAYWLGRTEGIELGGVAAWVYLEFETDLVDPAAWERSWRALIAAHDALRTIIRPDGQQHVLSDIPEWTLPVLDLTGQDDPQPALLAVRAAMAQQLRPADRWPLFEIRATLHRRTLRLHFGLDVLVADGWSMMALLRQWGEGARSGMSPRTPAIAFRDVALALARAEDGPEWQADRAWWLARLDALPPAPALPLLADVEHTAPRFGRRMARLEASRWARLQARAAALGITPAAALLTAYAAILAAWSAAPGFTINLTLFDRPPLHPDIEDVIGDFTRTDLLAVEHLPGESFASSARRLHAQLNADLAHRSYSGIRALRELSTHRGAPVLMPVVFTSGLSMGIGRAVDVLGHPVWGLSQTPQVWLDHQVGEDEDGLFFNWDAAESRFQPGTLDAMFAAYTALLEHLSAETSSWDAPPPPSLPASQLATRTAAQTWPGAPAVDTLHDPFLRQAARTPDATAVTGPDLSFTYAQLAAASADLARRLAHALRDSRDALVAVCLPKSPLQAVATLGILRAGAAYLPIDPDLPPARIRTLLTDGQAHLVVTDPATAEKLRGSVPDGTTLIPVLTDITEQPVAALPPVSPDALAYVIYTSGSTGQPKGVAVQHRAAWNTIAAISDRFAVTATDRVLALSALSFDLSVYDLFGVLAAGGTVVFPPPDGIRDPSTWPLEHITLWNTVPQLMEMLLESGRPLPPSLRLVLWSGDWIPLTLPPRVRQQLPTATLVGLGGATEAAIWSIGHVIDDIDPTWTSIPYGTPLPHQTFHILDESLHPRPDGVQGDLYIGGAGLAQGYWNDPEKTAQRFITHPTTGERLYRTGDLGRYFSNGSIEFLGRADSQVKIRGHRIELGEIESTLAQHPGVAAVVAGTPDRRRLVAWYVPRPLSVPPSPAAPTWDAAVAAARGRQAAQPPAPTDLLAATAALGERAIAWIAAALARLGFFTTDRAIDESELLAAVTPAYHRWLRRGLGMLEGACLITKHVHDAWTASVLFSPAAPPALDLGPAGARLVTLLDRYGDALPAILRGETSALAIFYAGGDSDDATDFYADAFAEAHALLAALLDVLPAGLRVLEVGGGGGGTTRVALPHARAGAYLFTDISRLFLEDAARRFPGLRTAVLDLDRDPADQDLRPGQCDVIVAGGALHVARDLRATLAHLAGLLAPGGVLLSIEATRFWPMMQVLTALQPGFDGFTDIDLRRDHCLLDVPGWTSVLRDAGFDRVVALDAPGSRAAAVGVTLLVARRDPDADIRTPPDPQDIRSFAAARLPDPLVPGVLVPLPALPLSANGKLDRAALPLPSADPSGMRKQPSTALERTIADVWADVLGLPDPGVDDTFFALGGDSLSAVRVAGRLAAALGRDVPLRLLLANPDVAALARALESAPPGLDTLGALPSAPPLRPDPTARFEPFPLTDVQRAYWLGRDPGLALGGVATWFYLEFEPDLADPAAWQRAWQQLIAIHDALRTVVRPDGAQQVLSDIPDWTLPVLDLRGRRDTADALASVRAAMQQRVLPADRFPLFDLRATIHDGPAGPILRLHFGLDLLVADGWGMMTLIGQWGALAHGGPPPAAPPVSFRDCVIALSEEEGSPAWQADRAWWLDRLDALPLAPALPLVARPDAAAARFVRREATLDGPRWQRFKRSAARHGLTPASALLAAFARILAAWSERPELTINLTLFNRPPLHPAIEQVVGDFTSTTLLATDNPAGEPFAAATARLQAQLTADLEHRRFGGLRVMRELSQHRGEATLFPVVFTSGLSMGAPNQLRGGRYVYGLSQTPQVLLDHQVGETGDGLLLTWDTADDRFLPGVLDAMFAAYTDLLHTLADVPDAWQRDAGRELPPDQRAVRAHLDHGPGTPPQGTLHAPFLRQAARTPDAPAIIGPDLSFTYAELAARSGDLARRLLAARSGDRRLLAAPPSPLVAICLPRGATQVVAVMAILRAGAAYLPIDPDLPPARIRALLTDAGARLVVTDPATRERLADIFSADVHAINVLQDIPQKTAPSDLPDVPPDALAYVIYTSGSTGRPKGVAVQHAAAWNTVAAINERFAVGATDRVLALSSLSFDLSVYDIVGPLAVGGALVIPAHPRDPQTWGDALARGVTVWNSVPQLLDLYLDGRGVLPDALRLVLLSGDWIPVTLPGRVRQQVPHVTMVSLGGATEASIWSIFHIIGRVDPDWTSIPYGTPLAHQTWHVRGPDGRDRPDHVTGELWIGGAGLARGYWNDPERTAERFVDDPRTGERLYRTGDLGRYLANGSIELVGRIDGQVKIAGHRVELGEVEAHLSRQTGVTQAVALAIGERDNRRLVAAVVGPASLDPEILRAALATALPAAMVPARLLVLPALPLGPTGKVDRRALADAFTTTTNNSSTPAEPAPTTPATGIAARVLAIGREVLEVPDLTLEQNLLRLGATSLDLIRLGNRLIRELGVKIESSQFLLEPTLAALLNKIGADLPPAPPPSTSPWTVIDDPDARESFKATDPGQRRDLDALPFHAFAPDYTADELAALHARRTRRHFGLMPIALETLAGFLSVLRRGPPRDDGRPGYHYASAGGIYAIQTYLHIKAGRVAGLDAGAYHYDPLRHGLVAVRPGARLSSRIHLAFVNQPIAEEAAFSLFLVGELAALGPLYGDEAVRLALLEAGAIAHLLESSARARDLGTCQIGQLEQDPVRACLDLRPSQQLLHTLLGGPLDPTAQPAADRKARLIERIRQLSPHAVQALLAARKATPEDD